MLHKIHAWLSLETPPGATSPYELTLRRDSDHQLRAEGTLIGGESFHLVLRARPAEHPPSFEPRYFYVFVIDSSGNGVLLFPRNGPPNHYPVGLGAPPEMALSPGGGLVIQKPYGMDTYFLLSSDEPIPNPWMTLNWDGVRPRGPRGGTALEELLSQTGGWDPRGAGPLPTPAGWSVERELFESVDPHAAAGKADAGGGQRGPSLAQHDL